MCDVTPVLKLFLGEACVEPCDELGNHGGFSGARLWKLRRAENSYCLRRWPASYPPAPTLRWIHKVLRGAEENGFHQLPRLQASRSGDTIVSYEGHLWQLETWLPGAADFVRRPTVARCIAATACLADFHHATRGLAVRREGPHVELPCLASRRKTLAWYRREGLSRLISCRGQHRHPRIPSADAMLGLFQVHAEAVAELLTWAGRDETVSQLQPCIRDVWHAHVLFQQDRVVGLIDFGGLQMDCPATDLARLLGSLTQVGTELWRQGIASYASRCPLTIELRRIVVACHAANQLMSGLNWLRWLLLDRRRFDEPEAVHRRIEECYRAMQELPLALAAWQELK